MNFDPESLLDLSSDSPMSTRENLVPEGEYEGTVETVKGRQTTSEKGTYNWLDVTFKIAGNQMAPNGQVVSDVVGRPSAQVRYSMILDLNDAGGLSQEQGRNVSLGRLREAVGQNGSGPWTPRALIGARARVTVKHRFDKDDPAKVYQEIKSVKSL